VTYTYTLVARDAAGNTSGTATTTGFITPPPPDTTPPTTPGNFTATEASSSSIQLTWTASTDNVGVTSYQIWRDGTPIAFPNGSATSFLDTGRTPGVVYTYQIQAYDSAQNQSGIATTTGSIAPPPPGDTTSPSVPGNFRVTGQQGANTTFAWNASSDNVGVAGYRVYINGSLAVTTSATSASTKIGKGSHAAYVVAYDAAGNISGTSNLVTVSR
jgi:chitodextrinase